MEVYIKRVISTEDQGGFKKEEEILKELKSNKLLKKLTSISGLNLKKERPFVTNDRIEENEIYYLNYSTEVNLETYSLPVGYLRKYLGIKNKNPLLIRELDGLSLDKEKNRIIKVNLDNNDIFAKIRFVLRNKNP